MKKVIVTFLITVAVIIVIPLLIVNVMTHTADNATEGNEEIIEDVQNDE